MSHSASVWQQRRRRAVVLPVLTALLAAPITAGHAAAADDTPAAPVRYEAEKAARNGVTVESSAKGFSGTGYVTGFDKAEDSLTFTIPNSPGGLYDLSVRFRAPNGQKDTTLTLNGSTSQAITLPATKKFSTTTAGRVLLTKGKNTIKLVSNWGWYEIDAIDLSPSKPRPPHQIDPTPVDPKATPQARSLLRYLTENYGKKILSGQQDMNSIKWVEKNVGHTPAVAGLDMMDYSPSRVAHGTTSREVENAIGWDKRGGIVTFTWHWNAPAGLIDKPGKEWWRGFYTDATTFNVAKALSDPNSKGYQLLLRDIDAITKQLKRLDAKGIPVLWRPLHEAEGGWFWWGAHGAEPAKKLYRLMYERMTKHHGLHNLIWVWNSVSPEWYPGDDVVDIVSADVYPPVEGDHGPNSATYEKLIELGDDKKIVALTENGSIPDPKLMRAYETDWSWFNTWSGEFIDDGQHNSLPFLRRVYGHEYVITLDELGDWKK